MTIAIGENFEVSLLATHENTTATAEDERICTYPISTSSYHVAKGSCIGRKYMELVLDWDSKNMNLRFKGIASSRM